MLNEQQRTSLESLDRQSFSLLADTIILEHRVADAMRDAERLLIDAATANARFRTD